MAVDIYRVKAVLEGSVTGTDQFTRFSSSLTKVGKTADIVNKQMASLNSSIRTIAGGFGVAKFAGIISEMARVTIQLDAFDKQLSIGFGAGATLELNTLRGTLRQLGIAQDEALGSAVRFTSALKLSGQTALDTNKNFEAASKLILANKLSADGAQRVYYAMAQIASKGKLMSEELMGQLGENLAGIVQQVAVAMNMSNRELIAAMKDGKVSATQFFDALRRIGDGIDPNQLHSAAQSLGFLKNAWFDFKSSVIAVGTVKAALDGATSAIQFLTDHGKELIETTKAIAVGFAAIYGARMLVPVIGAVTAAITFLSVELRMMTLFMGTFGVAEGLATAATINMTRAVQGLTAASALAELNPIVLAITAILAVAGVAALGVMELNAALDAAKGSADRTARVIAQANAAMGVATASTSGLSKETLDASKNITSFAGKTGEAARQLYIQAAAQQELNKQMLLGRQAEVTKQLSDLAGKSPEQRFNHPVNALDNPFGEAWKNMKDNLGGLFDNILSGGQSDRDIQAAMKKLKAQSLDIARELALVAATPLSVFAENMPGTSGTDEVTKTAKAKVDQVKKMIGDLMVQFANLSKTERQAAIDTEIQKAADAALSQHTTLTKAQIATITTLSGAIFDFKTKQEEANRATERAAAVTSILLKAEQDRAKLMDQVDQTRGMGSREIERRTYLRDQTLNVDAEVRKYREQKDGRGVRLYSDSQVATFKADLDAAVAAAMETFDKAQADLVSAQGNWQNGAKSALTSYGEEIANVATKMHDTWTNALKGTEDALVNFVMTGKLSFRELANSIIKDLIRIAIQQSVMKAINFGLNAVLGAFNPAAAAGTAGTSMQAIDPSYMALANGGAFNGNGIRAYASGDVFNRPTMFAYGGGLGVMGEAGPEAVMPLKRGANGKLGVSVNGGSRGGDTQNVVVNVHVEGGSSKTSGDPGRAAELGKMIASVVRGELVSQKRPGGLLAA